MQATALSAFHIIPYYIIEVNWFRGLNLSTTVQYRPIPTMSDISTLPGFNRHVYRVTWPWRHRIERKTVTT